jgi:hypothetical protein
MKTNILPQTRQTELSFYVGKWLAETGVPARVNTWEGTTLVLSTTWRDIRIRYSEADLNDYEKMRKKFIGKMRKYYKDLVAGF